MQAPEAAQTEMGRRRHERIVKPAAATLVVRPNLVDYETTCRQFNWSDARAMLDGLPQGRGTQHRP